MRKKGFIYFVILVSILSQCMPSMIFAKAKKTIPAVDFFDNGEEKHVWCTRYDLIAKNVKKVYIGSEPDFWELYIQQKNKISEVQLTEKRIMSFFQELLHVVFLSTMFQKNSVTRHIILNTHIMT